MSTNFIVAGGVGAVVNYAVFSQYTPVSMDLMLKEIASVVQPLAALKTALPALFGFLVGAFFMLIWSYLKAQALRRLLEYDGWFLTPKKPINKVWFMLMTLLLGSRNRGIGGYQDYLPSLPVPKLEKTCKKYLDSVRPLLTEEEYKSTTAAVKEFVEKDGKKLQWYLKLRSWQMRNWMADWWSDFIYLRQRTPICFNSNYYATDSISRPTSSQLDRAATILYHHALFGNKAVKHKVESTMATKMTPFDSHGYQFLTSTVRIPGEEKDEIVTYNKDKPTHGVVYRQGKFYMIEIKSPDTGKPHSPLTIRAQLEKVMAMAGDVRDETGVQNLTSLPRTKWAKLRQELMKNPVNRRSLNLIGSSIVLLALDTEDPNPQDLTEIAQTLFHGDGYSRFFDKAVTFIVTPRAVLGANVEHTPLDATVCGHLWEYLLTEERYDGQGRCLELYPGEQARETPNPSQLKWEVEDLKQELADAAVHLDGMIRDSDLVVVTPSYGKRVPKKCKLSPDGWFQMALQLAYYRIHHKAVLTYESATTRLYYQGRTETIRPVSDHSVAFVQAMDDPSKSKEEVKQMLKQAIDYQFDYKMEAMRGMGVDRHLFGLYVIAKGLKMDPLPKMFTDKAFNFSFLLSTSQTPVKTTNKWTLETSTNLGGFGCVCDEGYGVSYIIVGEDTVNLSIHSKRSCEDTSSVKYAKEICRAFEDMKNLFDA